MYSKQIDNQKVKVKNQHLANENVPTKQQRKLDFKHF